MTKQAPYLVLFFCCVSIGAFADVIFNTSPINASNPSPFLTTTGFSGLEFEGRTFSGEFRRGTFQEVFGTGPTDFPGNPFINQFGSDNRSTSVAFLETLTDSLNSFTPPLDGIDLAAFNLTESSFQINSFQPTSGPPASAFVFPTSSPFFVFNGSLLVPSPFNLAAVFPDEPGAPSSSFQVSPPLPTSFFQAPINPFLFVTETTAAATAAVPEPSTFVLLLFGAVVFFIGRRRFSATCPSSASAQAV